MARQRQLLLPFLVMVSMGMVLACGGGIDVKREEARKKMLEGWDEAKRKIVAADALWDGGEKAKAVSEYKTVYAKSIRADKEHILPRIVDFSMKAKDRNEAKAWIKRGLHDELEIEYTDAAVLKLSMAALKEHNEARSKASDVEQIVDDEDFDSGGLVLLQKSVKGARGQIGGEITGTVVNRRSRKLRYAQISFNLYDQSGAQVGTALANINGLEAGGRWNFRAVSGTDFVTYKMSELSGF